MPGFVFCSVEGTFTNKGSAPIDQIPFLGNLETADQKSFSPYEDNVSIAAALFGEDRLIPVSVANVQPTQTVQWVEIYQIPRGSRPTAIIEENSQIRLAVK